MINLDNISFIQVFVGVKFDLSYRSLIKIVDNKSYSSKNLSHN